MIKILLLLFLIIVLFYILNNFLSYEKFCNGNVYCNGNNDSALCINQKCENCGLQASCSGDSDCVPNNCVNGCCDNR